VNGPLLDLRLQFAPLREEILAAIARVCDEQRFIMGPEVEGFEEEAAAFIGARHAIGVSSGTDALLLALMALRVGPGDEVIVPTFTFFATAGSVARLGATPVFVDVDPATLTLEPAAVRDALTPRTRAIIPVHLYGLCADMAPIAAIAARAGVTVIEDAAQAIGADAGGARAGTLGAMACFSFFPSKNLGAFGDAGLVTTGDDALAARLRLLRNHGQEPKYHHAEVGGNFRLDALQAAVLRVKLRHLPAWTAARRTNAARYGELFARSTAAPHVRVPSEPPGRTHVYHQYVVRVGRRDRVRAHLAARGVGTEVYYPVPLHRQACFRGLSAPGCPHAEAAADEVLALPIYPELTPAQQAHVVDAMAECLP
jgi:dTDP-4-amino-4,6-dideoxygalactose transaminase